MFEPHINNDFLFARLRIEGRNLQRVFFCKIIIL
jgi:hypothetical protein